MSRQNQRRPLSPKQRRFVDEMIKRQNATEAAKRAGYSKRSARAIASETLTIPNVKAALEEKLKRIEDKSEITAARVLNGIAKIAEADLREAYNEDGTMKAPHEMPDSVALAIAGMDTEQTSQGFGETKKIRFWDKLRAYELLGKYLKLFGDDAKATNNVDIRVLIMGSINGNGSAGPPP